MQVPQTLFKYVRPERVDVLERNLVRYTQPDVLNDPFEGRVLARGVASREQVLAQATDDFMDEQMREALKQIPAPLRSLLNEKVLTFVKHDALAELPKVFDDISPAIATIAVNTVATQLRSLVGVLSLTEEPAHILMWAHYSAGGRGFVIGFDTSHPHFHAMKSPDDEFRHLRRVEYRESRSLWQLSQVRKCISH